MCVCVCVCVCVHNLQMYRISGKVEKKQNQIISDKGTLFRIKTYYNSKDQPTNLKMGKTSGKFSKGQKTHEKMLSILNHLENANQNHEIILYISENMEKLEPSFAASGKVKMENSPVAPQKIKHGIAL